MTILPKAPRIFALVVAVDEYIYKDRTFYNLTGCRNDGMRFIQYLTDILDVPRSRIVFLADKQATERAILTEFRRFLIHNVDIQRNDPIVFFFAGHGRRLHAPEGWVTEGGMIEVLCPHDIQTIGDDGKEVWGIPDRTIDRLMRELAYEKGNNIIAVFDCCFSGGLSRGEKETLYTRCLPEYSRSPPVDLHQDIVSFSRAAQTVTQSGFQYKAMESHVLFAACRPDERAKENPSAEDGPGGLFTSALIKALRDHSIHDTSCAMLFERLDLHGVQHPQCEGINKNRFLFSMNTLRGERPMFKVYRTDQGLCVFAGSIQGISKDTEFTVVSNTDTFALKAIVVRAFASKLEDTLHSIADDAIAYISSSPTLRIHSSVPLTGLTRAAIVPTGTYADVTLRRDGSECELERFDGLVSTYSDPVIRFEASEERIPDIIDAVASFHSLLYRSGDGGMSAFSGQVKTRLERLSRMDDGMDRPDGNDLFQGRTSLGGVNIQTAVFTVTEDENYCLTFENHSDVKLFLYLFCFDPSTYEIQEWYHPQGETTTTLLSECKKDGPSVFLFGYGAFGTNPIQFELAEGRDAETVFVKAFLTTTYVNLSHVAQATIDKVGGLRSQGSFRHGWASETFVLTYKKS